MSRLNANTRLAGWLETVGARGSRRVPNEHANANTSNTNCSRTLFTHPARTPDTDSTWTLISASRRMAQWIFRTGGARAVVVIFLKFGAGARVVPVEYAHGRHARQSRRASVRKRACAASNERRALRMHKFRMRRTPVSIGGHEQGGRGASELYEAAYVPPIRLDQRSCRLSSVFCR